MFGLRHVTKPVFMQPILELGVQHPEQKLGHGSRCGPFVMQSEAGQRTAQEHSPVEGVDSHYPRRQVGMQHRMQQR